jgi:hypothetical protein
MNEPERERLLSYIGQYLPAGMNPADVDLNEFAAQGPALFRLLEMKTEGRLSDAKTVTDKFLRNLDEGA